MSDNVEPAVASWYRNTARDRSRILGRDPSILEGIEASLSRDEYPDLAVRQDLDALGRESVGRIDTPGARGPIRRLARSAYRSLFGFSPHLDRSPVSGEPTRVLHAIWDLRIGGAPQLVIDLVRTAPVGSEQLVICGNNPVNYASGVRHQVLPVDPSRIRRAVERFDPEVVHVCHFHGLPHWLAWYEHVFQAVLAIDRPLVQSHCVIGDPWMGTDRQHLVFCSEWSRSCSRVEGIDDSVIFPGSPSRPFLADRRPISGAPRVGMVYRLDGDKIDFTAIDAVISVLRKVPDATMDIVGDGPLRPLMQAKVAAADLSGRVRWRGFLQFSELPAFYREIDVAMAPVIADTFGSGSVHATFSGTPVVGYEVAAIPGILRRKEALARPGDPEHLASRVADLIGDDRLHADVHATQLEHAMSNFQLEKMGTDYHRLFAGFRKSA
jgi:glycosyltransferase involved in cell wall biosynthesis